MNLEARELEVAEAADRLRLSQRRVRELLTEGTLQGFKLGPGRRWLIPLASLEAYGQRSGTPTTGRSGDYLPEAEVIRHWEQLRTTRWLLADQLRPALGQLVGLSMVGVPEPALKLVPRGAGWEAQLAIEGDVHFQALAEHLGDDGLGRQLMEWKRRVSGLVATVRGLVGTVEEELRRDGRHVVSPGPLTGEAPGLTHRYAQTAVSTALEDAIEGRDEDDFWLKSVRGEYRLDAQPNGFWILRWGRAGRGHTIAAGAAESELTEISEHHIAMRRSVRRRPQLTKSTSEYAQAARRTVDLRRKFERVDAMVGFPGTCSLCRGSESGGNPVVE